MENVITLGKLIGLLFCSLPPIYFIFENSKNTRNELTHPVMGTIFLVSMVSLKKGIRLIKILEILEIFRSITRLMCVK